MQKMLILFVTILFLNGVNAQDPVTIEQPTVGTGNPSDVVRIELYPNPTDGKFTVSAKGLKNIISIEILNSEGKVIHSEKVRQNSPADFTINFDLNLNPGGIYFVKVIDTGSVHNKRIIIN